MPYPAVSCTAITNCLPASCCKVPGVSSSSPKESLGSTCRSVGETLGVPPDPFPMWKVILTLTCGLVVTGLIICGVAGRKEDCAWMLFWGGRASVQDKKVVNPEASECGSSKGRVDCKGPIYSELRQFSVLVRASVLLLLWLLLLLG